MAIENEDDARFIAEKIRDGTLTGERKERAFADLEAFRNQATQPVVAQEPRGPQLGDPIPNPELDPLRGGDELTSIATSAIAEPVAGFAGIATGLANQIGLGELAGNRTASQAVEDTRSALTFQPRDEESQGRLEAIGKGAEKVATAVRRPVAGLVGLASLPFGVDQAAENVRRIEGEGIGPVAGEAVADITGSPALGAGVAALPTAIVSALGIRGINKVSPKLKAFSDDVVEVLQKQGIDPTDASPANVERIKNVIQEFTTEQQARIDAFKKVGIERPTRAQITRDKTDFQRQQELSKKSGRVNDELEAQEATLSEAFDTAIKDTQGRPVTSGSSVVDEVVGRSTKLDTKIGELYSKARRLSGFEPDVDLSRFASRVIDNLDSDGATGGLFTAVKGELRRRGVIDNDGNILSKVDVDTAEEIRKFINQQFDAKNTSFANSQGRMLKETLDDDVFRSAGKDIFNEARKAKADFESELSAAKISKFDKNNKSLVRDILENKIDPDSLVDRITSSKSYRATDLKQLRDYLHQTDNGIKAFDDLRAQVLKSIKEKAFAGPVDQAGVGALSRARLENLLNKIGDERLNVLFTVEERSLLRNIMKVAKLREPVRGTALGKGPSAQAIASLGDRLANNSIIGALFESISVGKNGKVVLNGKVEIPEVRNVSSPAGLAVPAVASQNN